MFIHSEKEKEKKKREMCLLYSQGFYCLGYSYSAQNKLSVPNPYVLVLKTHPK